MRLGDVLDASTMKCVVEATDPEPAEPEPVPCSGPDDCVGVGNLCVVPGKNNPTNSCSSGCQCSTEYKCTGHDVCQTGKVCGPDGVCVVEVPRIPCTEDTVCGADCETKCFEDLALADGETCTEDDDCASGSCTYPPGLDLATFPTCQPLNCIRRI